MTDGADHFERVRALQEQLAYVVRPFRRSRIGIHVADELGRVHFSQNAHLSFNPASNVKLLTAGTVLMALDGEQRFVTEVRGEVDDDGVVGPLFVRGGGDPSLRTPDVIALARQIAAAGVAMVKGPLVLDTSAVAADDDPPGYARFGGTSPYRAGVGALSLNDNVVRITVLAAQPGSPAEVEIYPWSPYLVRRGRVRTTRWRTRLRVKTYRHGDRTGVSVSGVVAVRHGRRQFWRRVFHPARYAGHTLLEQLRAEGVTLAPSIHLRSGRAPRAVSRLARHRSAPLFEILRETIKHSNNAKAEHLLLAAGSALYGAPASYPKARRALQGFLLAVGVAPGTYRVPNASGLARSARFKPAAMVEVLAALYRDFAHGPELLASLPLASVDGTLRRRFRVEDLEEGSIRAKTGTLAGVSCLSGYASANGRALFFALMTHRAGPYWRVIRLQRQVGQALIDYLRLQGE